MSSFDKYFQKNIAKQVRKYRTMNRLTQEQLSDMLRLNLKYIGHIERCERRMSHKAIITFLKVLQIQPSEFFSFEEPFDWNNN